MDLIVVESPTKARTLSRFLGKDYKIEASMGHIRDLPKAKLGVDTDHDFTPQYQVGKDKKETVARLQSAAREAKNIILATDPDREGEAIAWHLSQVLSDNLKFQRITFHEITETAIKKALAHPGSVDMHLVDAQQARRVLDRLVGYKLSPLLWRKVRRGLSAGRVQSVAVRLIVEKEREVTAFKPEEYWEIAAKLKNENGEFEAKLVKTGDKNAEIKNEKEATTIKAELEKAEFRVKDIQEKEIKRSPYPPFTTSTLQQAASNLFGWSAKRTMQVAQSLYEKGLITYHRTDSTNLAIEAVNAVRKFIGERYGEKYVPGTPKFYKTKSKVAQEAHEAIRPAKVWEETEKTAVANHDEEKLYELIWKRFVTCQMAEAVYRQTTIEIAALTTPSEGKVRVEGSRDYLFRAGGSKVLFDGWQKILKSDTGDQTPELPEITAGESLELLGLTPSQHFTQPPARYTEATLIKALEEYGIGRPSTYAPTISTILERNYIEKTDRKLIPTALGFAVNDFLIANFPGILDYKFTAGMEDSLDAIANGEKKWVPVIRDFYDPFVKLLENVAETAQRVKVETETTDEVCPKCGSPLVVRIGRFGKFLACSKFPDCKFTKTYNKKLDIKCPKCGGDIILKRTKSRKTFYGCANYPKCDFASWTRPSSPEQSHSGQVKP